MLVACAPACAAYAADRPGIVLIWNGDLGYDDRGGRGPAPHPAFGHLLPHGEKGQGSCTGRRDRGRARGEGTGVAHGERGQGSCTGRRDRGHARGEGTGWVSPLPGPGEVAAQQRVRVGSGCEVDFAVGRPLIRPSATFSRKGRRDRVRARGEGTGFVQGEKGQGSCTGRGDRVVSPLPGPGEVAAQQRVRVGSR